MRRTGFGDSGDKASFPDEPFVSSAIPHARRYQFDVLLVDEASQILPEDALGAVARRVRSSSISRSTSSDPIFQSTNE
jgi:hypothetical protein